MNTTGKDILTGFQTRWQRFIWLEVVLYAFGSGVFIGSISSSWLYGSLGFGVGVVFISVLKRPWTIDLRRVVRYLDQQAPKLEYSCGLLLQTTHQLPGLAQLQQQRTIEALSVEVQHLSPKHHLQAALISCIGLIAIGGLAYYSGWSSVLGYEGSQIPKANQIVLKSTDSTSLGANKPVLKAQQLTINYPAYTGLPTSKTSNMDIKAVEGSRVIWELTFEGEVDSVSVETVGRQRLLTLTNNRYVGSTVLKKSGFYNFRFTDTMGANYTSELYAIEVKSDRAPIIVMNDLKQFSSFEYDDDKQINWNTSITDDFGIDEAFIVATVSRGKGESVKFREEQLRFDESISKGETSLQLTKTIDLEAMNMQPGDELYFYVEARDYKQPKPNITRSETYFAVIKDTLDYGPGVDAGLGVDLMPDYFRSQRQLIIDTEKLISQRGTLSTQKFNSTSNDLGFDQKALRLKYGQFMGDETEYGMRAGDEAVLEADNQNHDQDQDPLAEYTHDHDGDNEHNLVEDDHEHAAEEGEDEDLLAEYLHNHSDPESSTLFTDNLKQKLRQALNIMWDAELHLRLNAPEKSLPYQYEALELIQDIKNSARIYVHRIGFDPPPIKEDKRLSGDLDEVENFVKQENLENPDAYASMRKSIERLEGLKSSGSTITTEDRQLFEQAGQELAQLAIDEPSLYLNTLRLLKRLTEDQVVENEWITAVQQGLLTALPRKSPQPSQSKQFKGKLNDLVLKALQ